MGERAKTKAKEEAEISSRPVRSILMDISEETKQKWKNALENQNSKSLVSFFQCSDVL